MPLKPMFSKISKNKKNEQGPLVDPNNNKTEMILASNEAEFEPVF